LSSDSCNLNQVGLILFYWYQTYLFLYKSRLWIDVSGPLSLLSLILVTRRWWVALCTQKNLQVLLMLERHD